MNTSKGLSLITSSYALGVKGSARYLMDLGKLRDPMGQADLRKICLNGTDPLVVKWIQSDPRAGAVVKEILSLAYMHLIANKEEGLTIGLLDTHGIWISPAIAMLTVEPLEALGVSFDIDHRAIKGK